MIKISACVITKNEEKHIGRWLDCVRRFADEIIVADTGSTDDTVRLVREQAPEARVYSFTWIQDFSAAKNFALEQAHGNWIVFLDADEYFSESSCVALRACLERVEPRLRVAGILCRWVNVDEDRDNEFQSASLQLRVFRASRSLRYQGTIHEALAVPKNRTVELMPELVIYHTGYSSSLVREKLLRNRALLEERIRAKGGEEDAEDRLYLMDCAYGLGEYEKAMEYSHAIREADWQSLPLDALRRYFENTASAMQALDYSPQKVLQLLESAMRACPETADFPLMKGLYLFQHGMDPAAAEQALREGLLERKGAVCTAEQAGDNAERYAASARRALSVLAQRRAEPVRISACVIVKNEERNIRRWLDSVRGFADEIIVVDTGSQDRTIELAKAGGAQLYGFPWRDDFAAAKNFALEKATGNWIVFPDADEYFSAASQQAIRPLLQKIHTDPDIVGVTCRLNNIDPDEHNRFMGAIVQLRIFRHSPELRYEGSVHEALSGTKGKKLQFTAELEIYHTGYSQSLQRKKMERNLRLLQQQAKLHGRENPGDYHYYMDCYYGLGDYAQAICYAQKILARKELSEKDRQNAYEIWGSSCVRDSRPEQECLAVLDRAIAACPATGRFLLMKGLYCFEQKDYLLAQQLLQQGMGTGQQAETTPESVVNGTERFWPFACWRLGDIARLAGDWQQAEGWYLKGIETNCYFSSLPAGLVRALQAEEFPELDCIAFLNQLYDAKQDAEFLAGVFPPGRLQLYYAKAAGKDMDTIPGYISAGRFDAAAEASAARLDSLYRLSLWSALVQRQPLSSAGQAFLPQDWQRAFQELRVGKPGRDRVTKSLLRLQQELGGTEV